MNIKSQTIYIVQTRKHMFDTWSVHGEYHEYENANKCYSDLLYDNPELEDSDLIQMLKKEIHITVVKEG